MERLGKVLIADDEQVFLETTSRLLSKRGYECETAADSDMAVKNLNESEFDVVIADIHMPGNSNLEMVKEIKDLMKDLPVILVTGHPSIKTAVLALELPVVSYLLKPFSVTQLTEAVKKALQYSSSRRGIHGGLDDFEKIHHEFDKIEQLLSNNYVVSTSISKENYVALSLKTIICSVKSIMLVLEDRYGDDDAASACQLVFCPRMEYVANTLTEAVAVLEKTRSSFKSKELGMLRQKLLGVADDIKKVSLAAKVNLSISDTIGEKT